ncbi:hypothetical protein ACOMHN_018052 [Nucella lapillus]
MTLLWLWSCRCVWMRGVMEDVKSHCPHRYTLAWCVWRCATRYAFVLNALPQSSHRNFFSTLWITWCFRR